MPSGANKYWQHTEHTPTVGWSGSTAARAEGAKPSSQETRTRQILRRHGTTFSPLLRLLFRCRWF